MKSLESLSTEKIVWIFAAVVGFSLIIVCIAGVSGVGDRLRSLDYQLDDDLYYLSFELDQIDTICSDTQELLLHLESKFSGTGQELNDINLKLSDVEQRLLAMEKRLFNIETRLQYIR